MERAKRIARKLAKPFAVLVAAVLAGIAGAQMAGTEVMKRDEVSPNEGRR